MPPRALPTLVVIAFACVLNAKQPSTTQSDAATPPAPALAEALKQKSLLARNGNRSPANANYTLDVRLDHPTRTLTASGTIRWRNIGDVATDTLRLHLYWNAWRDAESSWLREAALAGGSTGDVRAEDWGSIDVLQLTMAFGEGTSGFDLMPGFTFVQPDDHNPRDRTLAAVALPMAVAPGEEVVLQMRWQAHVPRTFARTGAIGDYYFIAHWFPKVAVFAGDRWIAHQFHANTEFFSDYGRYDVRMTVPRGWVLGATGTEQTRTDNADGTTTHHYIQDDVHDFAWTTTPSYLEHRRTFTHATLAPVQMRLLLQPEHAGQEDRHFDATAAALRSYGEWYGPYPYSHITIVDPAYHSGAGGMEYPTLFTAGTYWLTPEGSNTPEAVTVHEAGHQFWYGIVGNNEVEHAWLDEGLNMFSEARTLSTMGRPFYHVERFFGGFIPWLFRDIPLARETDGNLVELYRLSLERDDPATPTWRYWPETHWGISYAKTALWLNTLERYLGWETLQRILSTFFQRWQFRHPGPEDFFAVANEVSGRDLTWFFDQVHRSSNAFDYAVGALTNETERAVVVVRRLGEATFPVDVLTTFANGDQVTERWDGRDRWRAYTYENRGRAVSAIVDPHRVLLLDVDYTNNSRTEEPRAEAAAVKWSLTWMVWLQDLLLTWSFFV